MSLTQARSWSTFSCLQALPWQECSLWVQLFWSLTNVHMASPLHFRSVLHYISASQPCEPSHQPYCVTPAQGLKGHSGEQKTLIIPDKIIIAEQRHQAFCCGSNPRITILGVWFLWGFFPSSLCFQTLPCLLSHTLSPRSQFSLVPQENALTLMLTAGCASLYFLLALMASLWLQ